jgi:parallel beta-helix repeat protein
MPRHLRVLLPRIARAVVAITAVAGSVVIVGGPARAAGVLRVPGNYATIQAAIDAATPGSTVLVDPGTFREEVVVDKDLRLVGAGVGRSTIQAPASLTSYGVHLPDGRAVTAIVRVGNGARVRMSGFTVTGPIPCGMEVSGINVVQRASLDLTDDRVTGIQVDPTSCAAANAAGRAVVYGLPPHIAAFGERGSAAFGRVARVTVDHYQHAGISLTGPDGGAPSQVTVMGNDVRGGWTLPSFQYGIDVESGVHARVIGNTVTGNVCGGSFCGPDPINETQAPGISLAQVTAPQEVIGNRFAGNDVGIYQVVSPGCCRINGNTLDGNRWFGIVIQDGAGQASGNVIRGGQVGEAAVADFVDTTAVFRGDRITGTTVAPVREIDCCGVQATAVVSPRRS